MHNDSVKSRAQRTLSLCVHPFNCARSNFIPCLPTLSSGLLPRYRALVDVRLDRECEIEGRRGLVVFHGQQRMQGKMGISYVSRVNISTCLGNFYAENGSLKHSFSYPGYHRDIENIEGRVQSKIVI